MSFIGKRCVSYEDYTVYGGVAARTVWPSLVHTAVSVRTRKSVNSTCHAVVHGRTLLHRRVGCTAMCTVQYRTGEVPHGVAHIPRCTQIDRYDQTGKNRQERPERPETGAIMRPFDQRWPDCTVWPSCPNGGQTVSQRWSLGCPNGGP